MERVERVLICAPVAENHIKKENEKKRETEGARLERVCEQILL